MQSWYPCGRRIWNDYSFAALTLISSYIKTTMSKHIYGERVGKLDCLPDADKVTGLVAQANTLLEALNGTNKTSTLAQLDNVRHQLMYVAKIDDYFTPFQSGGRNRDIDNQNRQKRLVLKGPAANTDAPPAS